MSLRMSICAVISLGLTLGAHWVAGQAAQGPSSSSDGPPRVAGGTPASSSGSAVPAPSLAGNPSGGAPPRLAIPNPRPQGDGPIPEPDEDTAVAPPRIDPPGGGPGGRLPDLPSGAGDSPPVLADTPAPPEFPAASPLDAPPMIADGPADPGPDPFEDPNGNPPPVLPLGAPTEGTGPLGGLAGTGLDEPPSLPGPPAAASTGVPDTTAAFRGQGPVDDPSGISSLAPPMIAPDPDPAAGFPADPAFTAGTPDPFAPDPSALGAAPNAGAPAIEMAPPAIGMGLPPGGEFDTATGDPLAGQEPQSPGNPAMTPDPFPVLDASQADPSPFNQADVAPVSEPEPVSPPPAGIPAGDPGSFSTYDPGNAIAAAPAMPRPTQTPPDFSSAEPAAPADPSITASAAPRDGIGAMADTLADRLPEGPRDVQLNLDVAMPPTANINLPMKAVVTLRNEGRDDAFDVVVRLPLPDGLEHIESSPPADAMEDDNRTLVWKWASLPTADSRTIDLSVKPLKAVPMDLVPRVSTVMAAKSRTAVQEPKLKIDLVGPSGEQLKGTNFDFQVTLRNVGNGPARAVNLIAGLSGGLQGYDEDGSLNDARRFELRIGDLSPGEVRGPFPLPVRADSQGPQTCTIKAESPDVVPETPVATKEVTVVAPKLTLDVVGPESRPVGSVAEYVVTIKNEGTTSATDVAVALFAPESGNPEVPADAKYRQDPEKRLHSIYWRLPRLDKGESRQFRVPIRLDRIAIYTVEVAAHSDGFREPKDTPRDQQPTDVMGIADVKIVSVDRDDTVIDAGDTTRFEIRIRNDGSKEATNVKVDFFTNEWITVEKTDPPDASYNPENPVQHGFAPIDRLAPGVERTFVITVKAAKAPPSGQAVANFDVKVYWDDLPESAAVSSNSHVRIAEGQVARSPGTPPR